MRDSVCFFTGYRPEKMPKDMPEGSTAFLSMREQLREAILRAVQAGCTRFLSGMSRGFDLWAAEVVLELQEQGCPIVLWAACAFPGMEEYWEPEWQHRYRSVLSHAERVFSVCAKYEPQCYTLRDRFLVDQSSRCICFFDGKAGGTEYTLRYARRFGLYTENLADPQLSFDMLCLGAE